MSMMGFDRCRDLVLGLLLLGFSSVGAKEARGRPNVLFLFTDDQRFDTVRALGNPRIKTPHLDRLVERGVVFSNAYIMGSSSMAVCTPSRASLFSGRSLWNLECQGPWDFAISGRSITMAEVFRQAGYETFASGKNDPGFGRRDHFLRSFSSGGNLYYRGGHRGQDQTPLFEYPTGGDLKARKKIPVSGTFNADLFADACVGFLEGRQRQDEPFFAYVSFMTPHDPLNCPEEFLTLYQADGMEPPRNFLPQHPFDAGVHGIRDEKLLKRPLTEALIRQQLARYYALISHTDAQIGRILKALEASGHADNTIVVFASDNGLALGSHGLTGKQSVYEHSVRVPLVISGPGIPSGERRSQLCYLYDIYPTLCDLAGLKTPSTVEFSSLAPLLAEPGGSHRPHLYFAFMSWQRAVRDQRYKLIEYVVNGQRTTQLFDLSEDPEELADLSRVEGKGAVVSRLRRLLESERERLNDGASDSPYARALAKEFWDGYKRPIK